MTNKEVLQIALEQSALDLNCAPGDFLKDGNVVVSSVIGEQARKYYREPVTANLVTYGNNIVASVKEEVREIVEEYIRTFEFYHCFETPNMHWLSDRLLSLGHRVCFMAEYYLPDVENLPERSCGYELRLLGPEAFQSLYREEWSNALCKERKELDVCGVGAYDGETLIGMAGASADCDSMWQIGVDVLPAYRRRGIASAMTVRLVREILKRGKVPFYCSAWSNIRSVRNAVKSGFLPAWVELTVKPVDFVEKMNRTEPSGG